MDVGLEGDNFGKDMIVGSLSFSPEDCPPHQNHYITSWIRFVLLVPKFKFFLPPLRVKNILFLSPSVDWTDSKNSCFFPLSFPPQSLLLTTRPVGT